MPAQQEHISQAATAVAPAPQEPIPQAPATVTPASQEHMPQASATVAPAPQEHITQAPAVTATPAPQERITQTPVAVTPAQQEHITQTPAAVTPAPQEHITQAPTAVTPAPQEHITHAPAAVAPAPQEHMPQAPAVTITPAQEEPIPQTPASDASAPEEPTRVKIHAKGSRAREIVLDIFVYGFAFMLIISSTMFAFSDNTDKSIFGYRFYQVLTPSMEPEFGAGDMIFIKLCGPEEVQEGDVVTFSPNRNAKTYLTHRVVEVRAEESEGAPVIVTKGDANNLEDPPISGNALVGKYLFHIPVMGGVLQFIRDNIIPMSICIVAFFVLLIFLRSYFDARKEAT
jgi:signal peptidase